MTEDGKESLAYEKYFHIWFQKESERLGLTVLAIKNVF